MGSINKNKIVKKSRDTGTLKWKSEGQEWGCRPMQMSVFYINCDFSILGQSLWQQELQSC